jgi:putative Holliday junction resolvase
MEFTVSQDIRRDEIKGRIMGIDFGSKRIGISISDPTLTIAYGLSVLENNGEVFDKISEICRQYDIALIVVGLPLKLNGKHSSKTEEVLKFVEELESKLKVKVVQWDERFTTKIAQMLKLEMNMKKKDRQRKGTDDLIASTLILQSYLDYLKNKEAMAS